MILVVVLVHAVATDRMEVRDRVDMASDHLEMVAVFGVVDRIGLRHPNDRSIVHLGGVGKTEHADLLRGERDQLLIGAVPQAVPFEAEVLHSEAGLLGIAEQVLAPVSEVLDPADLHAGRVDVDPVVREEVFLVEHQRHDEEVAIPKPLAGLANGL